MTYRNFIYLLTLTFFCIFEGCAQQTATIGTHIERNDSNGVKSFTVSVPEVIFQDEPFEVVFTLKATHWKNGMPKTGGGLSLRGVKYNKQRGEDFTTLISRATYVCSRSGKIRMPQMSIDVNGQEVLSDELWAEVKINPLYGEELNCAQEWLQQFGVPQDSIELTYKGSEEDFMLFADKRHLYSVIVAKKELWKLVGQPVLAYSIGNVIGSYTESPDGYMQLLNHFRLQLANLKAGKGIPNATLPYQPQHKSVPELLGHLHWGQGAPYNQATLEKNSQAFLVGCVPLASAMVMTYHQWPSDLLDWSSLKPSYATDDNSAAPLSHLLLNIGLSIDAEFSKEATASILENVKVAFCGQYGYSGKMMIRDDLKDTEVAALLYRELDNGRPCIVSYGDHAFVCDGYNGDFFHFNLGWDGNFNGYYRIKLDGLSNQSDPNTTMFLKKIIYGIEPLRQEVKREVILTAPGTLSSALSPSDQATVTQLKITGPLNSSDIRLLRKMAGAPDDNVMDWQRGSLTVLDLSKASITADKQTYLTKRANGKWTQIREVGQKRTTTVYHLDKMDDKTWNAFVNDTKNNKMGVTYTRDANQYCWAHYFCQANIIGMNMFSDCSSLKAITLPSNIKSVDRNAFFNCLLLKDIKR